MISRLVDVACHPSVLAQVGKFEHLGMRFRGEYTELSLSRVLGLIAIPLGIFALFVALSWMSRLLNPGPEKRSHGRLFRELADAHDMTARERRLCHQFAVEVGLATPAEILLRPDLRARLTERAPGLAERIFRQES